MFLCQKISIFLLFFRLPEGPILAKDLAIEYKYLSNTSEWFFNARKRANSLIEQGKNFKTGKIIVILHIHIYLIFMISNG